jgi:hypothetical protein
VDPGLVLALADAATNIGHDGRGLEGCSIADGNTYGACSQSIKQAINQAIKQSIKRREKNGKLEKSNPQECI